MSDRPKAIILVTLDCVRPDHLGCYGYRGVDTPNIDWFAEHGAVFEQAICQAPNTWVSHASLFTGCNPYKHGVRKPLSCLNPEVATLAELFADAGYLTGGFPAHTLLGEARGFGRGFHLYDLDEEDLRHRSSAAKGGRYYREWSTMWRRAEAWAIRGQRPFLLWLHYMGTHKVPSQRLSLPRIYRERYSCMGQFFDGKISWADHECIGQIRTFLEKEGLLEESVVFLFSDHGDELPRSDPPYAWGGHDAKLLECVMKVPLVMYCPKRIASGTRVSQQVRLVDVLPTVLELAGLPVPAHLDGESLLGPAMQRPATPGDEHYAYIENAPKGWCGLRTERWKLIMTDKSPEQAAAPGPGGLLAALRKAVRAAAHSLAEDRERAPSWLYGPSEAAYRMIRPVVRASRTLRGLLRSPKAASAQKRPKGVDRPLLANLRVHALYNLHLDPDETTDVSAEHPEVVQRLRRRLREMMATGPRTAREVSGTEREEVQRRLEALGYR